MVGQILGLLLALLLTLLLIPLRLECICRAGSWRVRLVVLGFGTVLYPEQPKKKKKQQKTDKPEPEQAEPQKKKKTGEQLAMDGLQLINDLLPHLGRLLGRILRGITVRRLRLRFAVTGEDAAQVGIRYGQAQALCYTIYSELASMVRLREAKIAPIPDFTGANPVPLEADLRLSVSPMVILCAALCFVARGGVILYRSPYIQIKKKKDGAKDGTNTHR